MASIKCTPGPNWGRLGGNQPSDNSAAAAAAAEAAAAERRRAEDEAAAAKAERERKAAEEAEAKRKQEEFDKAKQQALRDMGITAGAFGLKNTGESNFGLKKDTGEGHGLKDTPTKPACKWGDLDSSVVDLRCLGLDPDKPIVIDPHVVRGQDRAFPAQIDPTTFQNANYNQGFEALMLPGVESADKAIQFFKQAQLQRPNDPLVRNGLLLAQDILKARQQKEQENKVQAISNVYQSMATLLMGDVNTAYDIAKHATQLDPTNQDIWNWSLTTAALKYYYRGITLPPQKHAEKLVGNALLSEAWGDYAKEVKELEAAKLMSPDDKYIAVMLDHAHYLATKYPPH